MSRRCHNSIITATLNSTDKKEAQIELSAVAVDCWISDKLLTVIHNSAFTRKHSRQEWQGIAGWSCHYSNHQSIPDAALLRSGSAPSVLFLATLHWMGSECGPGLLEWRDQ